MYYLNVDRFGNEILNGGGAPDFNPTPINYTPTASGNTQNLNSFVIDPAGDLYFIDEDGDSFKINTSNPLDVLTTVQPTPLATGNTTNLNTVFKDAAGDTWVVDYKGDAIKAGSAENVSFGTTAPTIAAVEGDEYYITSDGTSAGTITARYIYDGTAWILTPTSIPFKNLNEFHVDPNGNDTTGDGSQENPFKTISKAVSVAGQGDQIIVHAGVYNENVVLSTPNVALVGAQSEYGSLTQINGTVSVTASGTSVKIADIGILGAVSHTGTAPLYITNSTLSSTFTSSSSAYVELKNSSVQDGTITKSAGSMLIENSKIDNVNVTGAGTALLVRDSYQDGLSTISYGAGTIYSINNVVGGDVNIASGAVALEDAALAQGLPIEFAKEAETSDFMKLGMINPDFESAPTKIVTWDEVTGRLEISDFQSAELKTTSLTPVVYDNTTSSYVNAQADTDVNLADLIKLSDGTYIHDGKLTFTGHGYEVGKWYYLSQTSAGAVVSTEPTSGWRQQLFFVEDANTLHVDIEEGWNYLNDGGSEPDFSKTVYVNSTSPTTATIFDLNNPPTTNDDTLKADVQNIYIGTDGSTWTYNSSTGTYSTYVYPTTVPHGVFANRAAGFSVPTGGSGALISGYTTVANTSGSAWNAAAGTFTAQRAGWYDISANLMYAAGNWNANGQYSIAIQINGANVSTNYFVQESAVTSNFVDSVHVNTKYYLNVGDVVKVFTWQSSGSTKTTYNPNFNTFSIVQIA